VVPGKEAKPLSLLLPCHALKTYRELKPRDTAATVYRLFRSKHVTELKLIAHLTVVAAYLVVVLGAILEGFTHWSQIYLDDGSWCWTAVAIALQALLVYVGPVLAAGGIILAWIYQQGSTRLGIIDLFASEITTLCRATTILDYMKRLTDDFYARPRSIVPAPGPPREKTFTSEEDYFPVFNSNSKDLQVLEARVVTHITAFYTYMKATRDSFRRLATTPRLPNDSRRDGEWHTAMRDLIYMQFLACESGRKAVRELVEYQPDKDERTITILLTELVCYGFLMRQFDKSDVRYKRLELRHEKYEAVVRELCEDVGEQVRLAEAEMRNSRDRDPALAEAKRDEYADWLRAYRLMPEFAQRAISCNIVPGYLLQFYPLPRP